jgi:hypothetical protein
MSGIIISGVLFGIAFQIKLIGLMLLPLVVLTVCIGLKQQSRYALSIDSRRIHPKSAKPEIWTGAFSLLVVFLTALVVTFVIINFLLPDSYLHHLDQTWSGHFARTKSFEYGAPDEHSFDWTILLKNWDQTIPALIGVVFCLGRVRQNNWLMLPVAWFFLELAVFGIHKPWWSYYYVHNAVPTCWCAAIGVGFALEKLRQKRSKLLYIGSTLLALCAATWMGSRVYLQISTIRHSPQIYNSLVLTEIKRFKPFTDFMFTDEGAYSFHAGIPLPPKLAVLSLKRFWSGDMTNERLRSELWDVMPGLILLKASTDQPPYLDLLQAKYSLVYDDQKHRLFARKDLVKQANW